MPWARTGRQKFSNRSSGASAIPRIKEGRGFDDLIFWTPAIVPLRASSLRASYVPSCRTTSGSGTSSLIKSRLCRHPQRYRRVKSCISARIHHGLHHIILQHRFSVITSTLRLSLILFPLFGRTNLTRSMQFLPLPYPLLYYVTLFVYPIPSSHSSHPCRLAILMYDLRMTSPPSECFFSWSSKP